MLKAYVPISYD